MEVPMKRLLAATTLAAFGLVPVTGSACEYNDASAASASPPPAQLAVTPAPQASKVPSAGVEKSLSQDAVKQVARKAKTKTPSQKLAANTSN
jgi:hypothetical protein